MGFRRHLTVTCHTCGARRALGGSKKGGSYEEAERSGWRLVITSAGQYVWLCPPCVRKHDASSR